MSEVIVQHPHAYNAQGSTDGELDQVTEDVKVIENNIHNLFPKLEDTDESTAADMVEAAVDAETNAVDLAEEPAEDEGDAAEAEAAQVEENTDAGEKLENSVQERLTKESEQFANVPQEILNAAFAEDDESEDKEEDK